MLTWNAVLQALGTATPGTGDGNKLLFGACKEGTHSAGSGFQEKFSTWELWGLAFLSRPTAQPPVSLSPPPPLPCSQSHWFLGLQATHTPNQFQLQELIRGPLALL